MVYHHALACISSPKVYIISRRLYPLSQWWYTTASRWWYTMLCIDDIHAFRRDLGSNPSVKKVEYLFYLTFTNIPRQASCLPWDVLSKLTDAEPLRAVRGKGFAPRTRRRDVPRKAQSLGSKSCRVGQKFDKFRLVEFFIHCESGGISSRFNVYIIRLAEYISTRRVSHQP